MLLCVFMKISFFKTHCLLCKSALSLEYIHTSLPLQVCWVAAPQEERGQRSHRVLSLGSDGLLLVWRWPKQSRQLTVVAGYRLTAESVPRSLRAGRARGDTTMGGMGAGSECMQPYGV